MNDLNTPNTAPGYCPECGLPANIWRDVAQEWECSYCNWHGRNPDRPAKEPDEEKQGPDYEDRYYGSPEHAEMGDAWYYKDCPGAW